MWTKNYVTRRQILSVLSYSRKTGVFINKTTRSATAKIGQFSGYISKRDGYRRISVFGDRYLAHRLAWLIVYGKWPKKEIDHLDGNRSNNAIKNLRDVTRKINARNVVRNQTNNTSGLRGVHWHARAKKWTANMKHNGKNIYLGIFQTKELAFSAYVCAKKRLQPDSYISRKYGSQF